MDNGELDLQFPELRYYHSSPGECGSTSATSGKVGASSFDENGMDKSIEVASSSDSLKGLDSITLRRN